MKIGLSATLVEQGRSGVGQYLVQLLTALLRHAPGHEFVVFTLQRDRSLFEFARDAVQIVTTSEPHRPPSEDLLWHQLVLPGLAHEHGLDVLHVPSQRRMLWRRPCALVTTIHDPGVFRVPRSSVSRGSCPSAVFRALARRQDELVTLTADTARELAGLTGLAPERGSALPPGPSGLT